MRLVEGTVTVDDVDAFVADLDAVATDHDATLQAFDARYVVDRAHLERAVELADRAIDRDDAIARDRAVEVLLYAAGRRQINRAFEMGVGTGRNRVVVLVDGGDEAGASEAVADLLDETDPTLGVAVDRERVTAFFGIDEAELAATDATLSDLVRERVALLVVEK